MSGGSHHGSLNTTNVHFLHIIEQKVIKNYSLLFFLQIFQDGKLSHFIDGRGTAGNWMAYVNCARYAQVSRTILSIF